MTKNFFKKFRDEGHRQKAIQCAFEKDGVKFELQFHTVESHAIKNTTHPWYEIARRSDVDGTALHEFYEKRTRKAGEMMGYPNGACDIPVFPPEDNLNESIMMSFKDFILENNSSNRLKPLSRRRGRYQMEQINENFVTDYYVKNGRIVFKHVHPEGRHYYGGGKFLWSERQNRWIKRSFDREDFDIDHISEKRALKIAGVSHF